MFEGLENIDWQRLRHAYGSAKDIPQFLQATLSEDHAIRQEGLEYLFGRIFHIQGIYPATAPAIPFILELLESDHLSDEQQCEILEQLTWMTNSIPLYRGGDFKGLADEINTYRALWRGKATYLRLLDHPSPEVRALAAWMLARLPNDQMGAVRLRLWRDFQSEQVGHTQAVLLFALGHLVRNDWGKGAQAQLKWYETIFQYCATQHTNSLVRLAGALSWANLVTSPDYYSSNFSVHHPFTENVHQMVQTIIHEYIISNFERTKETSWWASIIIEIITAATWPMIKRLGPYAMLALLKQQEEVQPQKAQQIVDEALQMALNVDFRGAGQRGDISEIYKDRTVRLDLRIEVMQAIVQYEPFWREPTKLSLRFYGLPDSRDELEAWIKVYL